MDCLEPVAVVAAAVVLDEQAVVVVDVELDR